MKRIHNFYLQGYRFAGFIFLLGLVASIVWYGCSVLFFVTDSNWSVPFIISPNQENVLIHQERVLNMEHNLIKNSIDLATAKNELHYKQHTLIQAQRLYARMQESIREQSDQYRLNGKRFKALTHAKAENVHDLKFLLTDINEKEQAIEAELKSGLITQQEATAERISLSSARSALVDAKARMYTYKQRTVEYNSAAETLDGAADNLTAIQKLVRKYDLSRQIRHLKSNIKTLEMTVEQLQANALKKKAVLDVIKQSPYILATQNSTHVAFVPYSNLKHVKIGGPVYSCYLEFLLCYKSGYVKQIFAAEEYGKHPIFKSDIKGQYIGIAFNDVRDAQKKLLFFNSKPLLI